MLIVLIVMLLLIIAAVIYITLIMPRAIDGADMDMLCCDYAHRGLWSENAPENSLAAFELAVKAGYGIELDVQLSRDGEVMVFHDYSLLRMTGCDKKLSELDASELSELRLDGSDQAIPTLKEVLDLVDGRAPLLIELKGEEADASLCPKVAKLLRDYKGAYCFESFNPLLVGNMKKQFPDVFCGLLYTNVCREKEKYSLLNIALTVMALNVIARPDFIAYNQEDRDSIPVRITAGLYGAPRAVWTVRTREELDTAHKNGEMAIFENIF